MKKKKLYQVPYVPDIVFSDFDFGSEMACILTIRFTEPSIFKIRVRRQKEMFVDALSSIQKIASNLYDNLRKSKKEACRLSCYSNALYDAVFKEYPNLYNIIEEEANKRSILLEYQSDEFLIPISFLGKSGKEFNFSKNLLGTKLIISRNYFSNNDVLVVEPKRLKSKNFKICSICYENSSLPAIIGREKPFLQKTLKKKHKIRSKDLTDQSLTSIDDFEQLLDNNEFDLFHFACHIENGSSSVEQTMTISDEVKLTIADQNVLKKFKKKIVFINGCKSATQNSSFSKSIAKAFLDNGAFTVIGIDFEVPDDFAAEFIEEFYKHFSKGGVTIFESIHKSIASFTNSDNPNIIGLFYQVYGNDFLLEN